MWTKQKSLRATIHKKLSSSVSFRQLNMQAVQMNHDSIIMVCGCFSSAGVGDLIRIDGIMKKETNAISSGLRLIGHGFAFMQDNDPKYTSKICKKYINQNVSDGIP